ncbi:chromosome complete related protein, putative [Babesia ovis]|uniref:Chromosome complete related protein, putative n=1 Tax=Babesia ovis TaxID=5869 RepID=A0A9W5TBH2_BABOV|nr:chromosome complete related protein, putative [Babesia ovis]
MAENSKLNVLFNGVNGACYVQDSFLFFNSEQGVFKWSFATWMRSEKSKKTPKVRLTFTEGPLKLTRDDLHSDALEKAVIVADFVDDRDAFETFCSLVSSETAVTKVQKVPQPPPEPQPVPKTEVVEEPVQAVRETKDPMDTIRNQRKRLLEVNQNIANLYHQLVESAEGIEGGVVSEEDFWNHHSVDLIAILEQPEAPSHLDGFIATPPINEFVNGQRVYRYNPELGRAILSEDATIRALHKKFVVDKRYPEENFWKRILQSRHFYHMIGEKAPDNQILYDDIKGVPIERVHTSPPSVSNVLQQVDVHSELIRLDDLRKRRKASQPVKQRFGDNVTPDLKSSLFDRFNTHAAKIMDNCHVDNALGDSTADLKVIEERAEGERKQKIADVVCHDLTGHQSEADAQNDEMCIIRSLNMPGQRLNRGNSLGENRSDSKDQHKKISFKMRTANDNLRDIHDSLVQMKDVDILSYVKAPLCNDNASRRMFILNTKLCQTEKITQTVPLEYDNLTISKMRNFQMSIMEILQMYYRTHLPEEDKRMKLLLAIRQIKQHMEGQHDFVGSAHAAKALQTGLMNQITAVEVYDTKLKAFVADLRNQAQQRMSRPK